MKSTPRPLLAPPTGGPLNCESLLRQGRSASSATKVARALSPAVALSVLALFACADVATATEEETPNELPWSTTAEDGGSSADTGRDTGARDAGRDTGSTDASRDTGAVDAGRDTGVIDAGNDTGNDTGITDAGPDVIDAGPVVLPPRTAGCGAGSPTPAAGTNVTMADGRSYLIIVPANYNPATAYPIVYLYHGIGSTGPDFRGWFEFEKYGAPNGQAIIVYPTAINGAWDKSGTSDLTFFDRMNEQIQSNYCTNAQRVFALGFSYGGQFMNHLACKRSQWLRAASIGDGTGGDRAADAVCGRIPMLLTHRRVDTDELYSLGVANSQYWATKNGCSQTQQPTLDPQYQCNAFQSCIAPGQTIFCTDDEDLTKIPGYQPFWDHTITRRFAAFTWTWFKAFQ